MVTYPIVAPLDGEDVDAQWAADVTGAANDHATLEAQVSDLTVLVAPGWVSYSPAWTADGTVPSLGNGTLTGRYRYAVGLDLVYAEITLTMGSTTTFGTSFYRLSLPVDAHASTLCMGAIRFLDSGTIERVGTPRRASASTIYLVSDNGVTTNLNPYTFANGDIIQVLAIYQPA